MACLVHDRVFASIGPTAGEAVELLVDLRGEPDSSHDDDSGTLSLYELNNAVLEDVPVSIVGDEMTVDTTGLTLPDPGLYRVALTLESGTVAEGYAEVKGTPATRNPLQMKLSDLRRHLADEVMDASAVVAEEELSDFDLAEAVFACIDFANSRLPDSVWTTVRTFQDPQMLMKGAAGHALRRLGMRLQKNRLTTSSGGVNVDSLPRAGLYIETGSQMWDEFRRWVVGEAMRVDEAAAFAFA